AEPGAGPGPGAVDLAPGQRGEPEPARGAARRPVRSLAPGHRADLACRGRRPGPGQPAGERLAPAELPALAGRVAGAEAEPAAGPAGPDPDPRRREPGGDAGPARQRGDAGTAPALQPGRSVRAAAAGRLDRQP